ncbi:MAG TPA: M6 family metalloprotease domain-containing protein [Gemmatimonadales bacterium]|nr:M6 family metalloprotease domain-containing protein [Gemmatimonadales bacterium]
MPFRSCLTIALALGGLAFPLTASAQGPVRPVRRELPGFDFRRDGAWRKHTRAVREARRQLLRSKAYSALNNRAPTAFGGAAVAGTYRVPVILFRFSDVGFPAGFTTGAYQSLLFSPTPAPAFPGELRPYSVKTFYQQLSDGAVTIDGNVFGVVTTSKGHTYYEDGCNGIGVDPCANPGFAGTSARFGELLTELLAAVDDGSVDWGQFDNDGIDGVPNSGDDDGFVDFVAFIHPELDGACSTSHLWSHRFVYSAVTGATPYVTKTPRTGGGFIRIDDYILQSGVGGRTSCTSGQMMPIGTFAHETGHAFGLPDLYDTNPDANLATEGIGEWGLMGSGNYAEPYSPSRFEAWSLVEMGWVTVAPITASGTYRVGPVATSDSVFLIDVPGTDEHFLVENRQPVESDTAQLASGACVAPRKSPGLLVWHIDRGKVQSGAFSNTVNQGNPKGVALLQADGLNHLGTPGGGNRGDCGDAYPSPAGAPNRRITLLSNPAATDNQGKYVGFGIDSIHQVAPGGEMVFRVTMRGPSVFTTSRPGATLAVTIQGQSVTSTKYEDVVPPGEPVGLAVASPQVVNGGRTRLTFGGWSDGDTQATRTFTSSAGSKPDTVLANFSAEHRVQFTVNGQGSVSAVRADQTPVATGTYVPEHTPVTLTATPAGGESFAGWSGDTVTTNATLVLPMGRGYNVTANFSGAVAVSVADAANQLLQGPTAPILTSAQRAYLDAIGNQNGGYDVGDFLAYLASSGTGVSPELVQRVLAAPAPPAPPSSQPRRK